MTGVQTCALPICLGYIASWSKGKELAELRASLEIINKTSSEVITGIDTHFAEIVKERGIDLTTEASVPEQAPDLNKGQITEDGYNIEVDGHIGTWYVIDTEVVASTKYFLLEHEEHGDGAACVIMDSDGKLVLDDVWNGFNDLKEHFERRTAEEQRIDEPIQHDYPMPAPTVSIDDRNTYGYTSDELLPLSKERAAELWELDLTVYLLYEDNTEAMAFDREDIDNHDGFFGIEKTDWLDLREHEGDSKSSPDMSEQLFLERTDNAFAIYQLKDSAELRDYRFEGLGWINSKGLTVEHDNYNFVYSEPFTNYVTQRDRLEELWDRFNNDHPADFKGHSLSVSDIVAIKQDSVVTYHYCDSFDFVELPKFAEPTPLVPDSYVTGEKIDTPRGRFSLTTMTKEIGRASCRERV